MADPTPQPDQPADTVSVGRTLTLILLALVALGSVGMFAWHIIETSGTEEAATAPLPQASAPPAAPAAPSHAAPAPGPQAAATQAPVPPTFDIVRVDPSGSAVIAGRGDPNANVSIRSDGNELGHVAADSQGAWAFGPTDPLPPGSHALTLLEHTAGGRDVPSEGAVVMVVPEHGSASTPASPPLVVATGPGQAPTVLQGPPGTVAKPGHLGLGAVEYGDKGELRLSGTAPPNATVRLYADNHPIGEAHTGANGRWSFVPGNAVPEGTHNLRLDQLGPQGKVVARQELPFRREPIAQLAGGRVVVQPGTNLWRIAMHTYGKGTSYTVIYQANHDQIRDPNLIYPGQVFALPGADGAASPASSSKSK